MMRFATTVDEPARGTGSLARPEAADFPVRMLCALDTRCTQPATVAVSVELQEPFSPRRFVHLSR